MSLPIPGHWWPAAEAASHLAPPLGHGGGTAMMGRQGGSVLIVEEDPELRSLLTLLISAAGFRVHAARDEAEGLKLFRWLLPDAVVTDDENQSLGGTALSTMIRSEEPGSPMPIVLLTSGSATDRDGVISIDRGADFGGVLHALLHILAAP